MQSRSPSSVSNSVQKDFFVQHVSSLPHCNEAGEILRRIHSEFQILIQKRGYNVTSVTELCCCGDGVEHVPDCNSKRTRRSVGRKRTMPDNVLGYNLTTGHRRHRIHLRLRYPHTHTLYPYDDIAGTMYHELAHCKRAPHDAQFYQIMDEIMEQHAIYLTRGLVVDTDGFPMKSNFAYVLGGGRGKRKMHGKAIQRWGRMRVQSGGRFLGSEGKKISSSLSRLPPREAARIAAEQRIQERKQNDDFSVRHAMIL